MVFCKDSFSLKHKLKKEEKSVEIYKLWLFSVTVSKLNGRNIKILKNGSALDLEPEDLDSNPSFIYHCAILGKSLCSSSVKWELQSIS